MIDQQASSDDTTALTHQVHEAMPLCATLGVTATELTADRVVLHAEWEPELCTSNGVLHGGAIMADAAGGASAMLNLPDDAVGFL